LRVSAIGMRSTQSTASTLGSRGSHPAAAGIVAGERHNVGAAVLLEQGGGLGGAHLGVVDRVGHQPVPVVGGAEPLGGVASGFRGASATSSPRSSPTSPKRAATPPRSRRSGSDLHQPNRLGRRHVALIEGALRAHDRIDDAAIELGTDRTVSRHPDVGKSVLVHRQAARERRLADEQHRSGIVVVRSELLLYAPQRVRFRADGRTSLRSFQPAVGSESVSKGSGASTNFSAGALRCWERMIAKSQTPFNKLNDLAVEIDTGELTKRPCSPGSAITTRTMAKAVLSILGLLLLAACNDAGSSSAPTPRSTVVPMNAQAWSILYSPGMPPHPTPQTGGGWYFDFPTALNSVHYVLAAVNIAASNYVDASILVTTTETPVFVYNIQPDNTCVYPAHVRCKRKVTIYRERTARNTLDGSLTA